MRKKNTNPLYVVKGNQVEEANNLFQLVAKKLGVESFLEMVIDSFKTMLSEVQSYSTFMQIKNLFDVFMQRIELFRRFSI